ncbi:Alkanesulfonates transport ATP-binding protein [Granulibacter bethesdensis CGDNIH4]|nr:Alkanesulfonates transport ATP-binding protein [Granulibacter bethesdensis CGDNIH4]
MGRAASAGTAGLFMAIEQAYAAATLLQVRIEAKNHGVTPVLRDISFDLHRGDVLAIMGRSGCGKTSLLRILAGLDDAYSGQVSWAGYSIRQRRNRAFPRIGMVFQEPLLLPWKTLRQNVALMMPAPDEALIERLFTELGLKEVADSLPGRVSLGMARRAALVRALASKPDILLLDEPFASLDKDSIGISMGLLRRFWRSGTMATVMVTHEALDAARLANRVMILGGKPAGMIRQVDLPGADPSERSLTAEEEAHLAADLQSPEDLIT